MLARMCYAISACWRARAQLQQFMSDPSLQIHKLIELTPYDLFGHDVRALILDFDGVMASHAEEFPREEVRVWLSDFAKQYAPYKIYILSNLPTAEREAYFKRHFPDIIFVRAKRKKPYPDGLQEIVALSGLAPQRLLLVDDRLATGIIAAISVGVQGCWVTEPYVNLKAYPLRERWFMFMRWYERVLVKLLG